MKRLIRPSSEFDKDKFDIEWEREFGPEQQREFDSIEDFEKWMREVADFEVSSD